MGEDRRVEIVNEHVRLENAYEFPACVAQFGRPQYQLMPDGEFYDGSERVNFFLSQNHHAFPDFHFELTRVSPTTDAVLVEGRFTGTQQGSWRGLPATGRKVDFPMCLIFEFDGDTMVNEKVYFDLGTPLDQLGVAYSPNSLKGKLLTLMTHPVTITRAILRTAWIRLTRRKK